MKWPNVVVCLFFSALSACHEHSGADSHHAHNTGSAAREANTGKSELKLNDEQKWKLDEPTRVNMQALSQLVLQVKAENPADFATLARELEAATNWLVSQCHMKGADHDMLHIWLESYLSDLKLLNSENEKNKTVALQNIKDKLKQFDFYFE